MNADRSNASTLTVSFTFTLAEFATLVKIVDEGMWELCMGDRTPRDVVMQDRVCEVLGLPGYGNDDHAFGAMRASKGVQS